MTDVANTPASGAEHEVLRPSSPPVRPTSRGIDKPLRGTGRQTGRQFIEVVLLASLAGIGGVVVLTHWSEVNAGPPSASSASPVPDIVVWGASVVSRGVNADETLNAALSAVKFVSNNAGAAVSEPNDPSLWVDLATIGAFAGSRPGDSVSFVTRARDRLKVCVYERGRELLAIALRVDLPSNPALDGCPRNAIRVVVYLTPSPAGEFTAGRLRAILTMAGEPVSPPKNDGAYRLGDEIRWGTPDAGANAWLWRPDWSLSQGDAHGSPLDCGATRAEAAPAPAAVRDLTNAAHALLALAK
jgi:hypothetical protein